MTISFNYTPFPYIDFKTKKEKLIYRPLVSFRLASGHTISKYLFHALLDSGADHNLFPAAFAPSVGLNIKKGKLVEHMGIGGVSVLAYRNSIKIYIGSRIIQTEADFSENQKIPLLGRTGFFKFFKSVRFEEDNRKFFLEY